MYEKFEQLLAENHLSVAQFCKETGMSRSTLYDWKNGKFKLKEDKRKQIASYFNVSLAWLDGESEFRTINEEFRYEVGKHNSERASHPELQEIERSLSEKQKSIQETADIMVKLATDKDLYLLVEHVVNGSEEQKDRLVQMAKLMGIYNG